MGGKPHSLNGIGHFDIAGPDFGALQGFYTGVLGWQITPRGPGYGMVATPEGGPDGALVEAETASASWCPTSARRSQPPKPKAAPSPCRRSTMAG